MLLLLNKHDTQYQLKLTNIYAAFHHAMCCTQSIEYDECSTAGDAWQQAGSKWQHQNLQGNTGCCLL